MVSLASLWLPILLGAVAVFFVSSLVHMALKWHNSHYLKFSNEEEVRAAINKGAATPGHYVLPWCIEGKEMNTPGMQQKYRDGPIGHVFISAKGVPSLGAHLGKWFALALVISILCAYIAEHALPAGAAFGDVLRIVWATGLLAYGAGPAMDAIWHARPGREVLLDLVDATLYGVSMALPFALLWPSA